MLNKNVDARSGLEVGRRSRLLRQARRETLQEVADDVGKSRGHIWQLEDGRIPNPRLDLLRSLADHYHCTIDYLIGGDDLPASRGIPNDIVEAIASLNPGEVEFIRTVLTELPRLNFRQQASGRSDSE